MIFANVPQGEEWRIDTLVNLLAIKFDNYYIEDFSFSDINAMIHYHSCPSIKRCFQKSMDTQFIIIVERDTMVYITYPKVNCAIL